MLKTIYQNFVDYFNSLDTFSKVLTSALLIVGTINLTYVFLAFGISHLVVAILDYGIVYYGYRVYRDNK